MAAKIYLCMAFRERVENIRQVKCTLPDGTDFKFERGIPQRWEALEHIPDEGIITFQYMCSPEDRKLNERVELAKKWGAWHFNVEARPLWWSAIAEVPEAVLEFLYHLMRNSITVSQAFVKIDGHDGNGEISLQELQAGADKLGWKTPELCKEVFRYLDPDNGGSISIEEWDVLHQSWKELQLSIIEFLKYIDRKFEDFDQAYEAIDDDDSDSVELHEWLQAVEEIGYFGSSLPIFRYMAVDGKSFSREDWKNLEDMWNRRDELLATILRHDSDQ